MLICEIYGEICSRVAATINNPILLHNLPIILSKFHQPNSHSPGVPTLHILPINPLKIIQPQQLKNPPQNTINLYIPILILGIGEISPVFLMIPIKIFQSIGR